MKKNLAKNYNPHDFEDRIYKMWEDNGAFHAEVDPNKEPYSIIMPPPNITGQLHMGHALDQTLQDALIRFKRMQGYSALWMPGSDHASIATEVKVANNIKETEGKTKEEIGREKFLERAWEWKKQYGGLITKQCRKIGDSCDWERERFTMDEGCSNAVKEAFVKLYNKGLIYRGNRLINWCPECGTSLSDAEVEHEDKNSKYWYMKYPAVDWDGEIVVATSRPETMFADVAIAVSPKDERYTDLIGKKVRIPLLDKEIPIIEDEYPDPEKGTGAVKITPAHDFNDFEVGQRHNLEVVSCINPDATMNSVAGKYEGMDRFEARKAWVKDLDDAGYLVKTEEKEIPTGTCYRCHTIVEPMLSEQWFVKMKDLAKPAIEAAKTKKINIIPERFEKIYLHWLEDIHDWCISRQLWWGHRIPAYYCQDCGEIIVSAEEPNKCPKCGSSNIKQDEDVLDTWFSSALWPFSTLGWPEKTPELEYFYPTNVLITAYDIIFFWVVRMAFSGLEHMGEVPFKDVYIHGLVRDSQGRKMSKSLGNGIDPLKVIDQYGADALRFMLTNGISPGNDMRFTEDKIESARNFANKLWNASRFAIMNLTDDEGNPLPVAKCCDECCGMACGDTTDFSNIKLRNEDKWIISRINDATKYVTENIEKYELSLAGQKIYDLIWNEFCDWYIEFVKPRLWSQDEDDKKVVRFVLIYSLKNILKLLHPFMPFITEEIWSFLPHSVEELSLDNPNCYLIKSAWPEYDENKTFVEETDIVTTAMEAIKSIRNIRAEKEVAPSKKLKAVILVNDESKDRLNLAKDYITNLGNLSNIDFIEDKSQAPKDALSTVIHGATIYVALDELVDYKEEFARLTKEQKKLEGEVKRASGKLANENFVAKAPKELIQAEKDKLAKYQEMLDKVKENIKTVEEKL